jgi:hypothetical protein
MDKDEALKLALEKVANALPAYIEGTPAREYLAVIHSALAAPVQEPVAWRWTNGKGWLTYGEMQHDRFESTPLYTTPPAAQPAPVVQPVAKDSRECPYCYHNGSVHCGDVKDKILSNGGDLGYCSNAQIYGRRAQPAPVQPVALRPEDVTVEVLMVQSGGGFAPIKTHGVKLTHKPTGIVVQCSSERSQHRNREQALRDLERYLHGARPQPTPPAAQPEPNGWAISYDGKTPYAIWPEGDGPLLDLEVKRQGGTCCKLPIYITPPAAQPAPVQEPLHDEKVRLIAHNECPEDWDSLDNKECWLKGFVSGFKTAERERKA